MLLIDPRRNIASIPSHASLIPFILKDFDGDAVKIATFLARAAPLERLIPPLLKELTATGHPPRLAASIPMLILAEAARAIAWNIVQVGQTPPEAVTIEFLTSGAMEDRHDDALRFGNSQAAMDFLRPRLKDPKVLSAFASALAHRGANGQPAPAGDALIDWLATQLLMNKLALFPVGADTGRLRIAWVSHQAPTKVEVTPAASPPPPSPVAQIVQTVESTLPDLPAEISAQAQTLIDAAKEGVPFCEECAKAAAAALLGV